MIPCDQLNHGRTAHGEQRVDGRAGSAPGIEHIVHDDHALVGHVKGHVCAAEPGHIGNAGQIVAVQHDIQFAHRYLAVFNALDVLSNALSQRHAAAADAHQAHILAAIVALNNLMGNARQRAADRRFIHQYSLDSAHITPNPADSCPRRRAAFCCCSAWF